MERMGSGLLDRSASVYGQVKIADLSGYEGRGIPSWMPPVVSLLSQRHRAFTRAFTTKPKTNRKQRGSIRSTPLSHVRPPDRRSALYELPGARTNLRPQETVHGSAYINVIPRGSVYQV